MKDKQQAPYSLRMPPEMRDALEKSAKVNRRSLNAELLLRLERSLSGSSELPVVDMEASE